MDGGLIPIIIGGHLVWKSADDNLEKLGREHIGEVLSVSVHVKGRSIVEHNRYRAILRHGAQNLIRPDGSAWFKITSKRDLERAAEVLHYILRRRAGYTVPYTDPETGEEYTEPKSTDFNQPEEAVEEYRCIAYGILAELLGCTVRDLVQMGRE